MEKTNNELGVLKEWFATMGILQIEYLALFRDHSGKAATARAINESAAPGLASQCWDIMLRPTRGIGARIVMLDDLSANGIAEVSQHWRVAAVETSDHNFQVWISVNRAVNEHERLQIQRMLSKRFGSDGGSVSGEHYGRAPGFANRKPGRCNFVARVTLAATSGRYLDADAVLDQCTPTPVSTQSINSKFHARSAARPTGRSGDHSADEFGWVVGMLRSGISAKMVTDKLSAECSDRRGADANRYATRTIKKAIETLEG